MCAVLEEIDGRLQANRIVGSTGRLFCCDVRRTLGADRWEYQILIDPRRSDRGSAEPTRLWITGLVRKTTVEGLWEADVVAGAPNKRELLRLNANPPAHVRPSSRMRSLMTRIHEARLFPHGLPSTTGSPDAGGSGM